MPPTATPPNEIAPAETVLTPSQSGQTVAVSIGELIAVVNPDPTIEWQVDYGSAILTLLASPADAGTDDWLFEAAAEGTTDLALTSSPPPCSATPCPSTVIRLVYSIEVTAEEMAPDATVITPAQANQSVSVQVGEQIIVENPDPTQKWQVDYAPAILTLLASPADAGTNDWLFEAAAEGTTDLALTSSPPPCPGTPCPSTVMRLVYSIEVSP